MFWIFNFADFEEWIWIDILKFIAINTIILLPAILL